MYRNEHGCNEKEEREVVRSLAPAPMLVDNTPNSREHEPGNGNSLSVASSRGRGGKDVGANLAGRARTGTARARRREMGGPLDEFGKDDHERNYGGKGVRTNNEYDGENRYEERCRGGASDGRDGSRTYGHGNDIHNEGGRADSAARDRDDRFHLYEDDLYDEGERSGRGRGAFRRNEGRPYGYENDMHAEKGRGGRSNRQEDEFYGGRRRGSIVRGTNGRPCGEDNEFYDGGRDARFDGQGHGFYDRGRGSGTARGRDGRPYGQGDEFYDGGIGPASVRGRNSRPFRQNDDFYDRGRDGGGPGRGRDGRPDGHKDEFYDGGRDGRPCWQGDGFYDIGRGDGTARGRDDSPYRQENDSYDGRRGAVIARGRDGRLYRQGDGFYDGGRGGGTANGRGDHPHAYDNVIYNEGRNDDDIYDGRRGGGTARGRGDRLHGYGYDNYAKEERGGRGDGISSRGEEGRRYVYENDEHAEQGRKGRSYGHGDDVYDGGRRNGIDSGKGNGYEDDMHEERGRRGVSRGRGSRFFGHGNIHDEARGIIPRGENRKRDYENGPGIQPEAQAKTRSKHFQGFVQLRVGIGLPRDGSRYRGKGAGSATRTVSSQVGPHPSSSAPAQPELDDDYSCDVCERHFQDDHALQAHLKGRQHLRAVNASADILFRPKNRTMGTTPEEIESDPESDALSREDSNSDLDAPRAPSRNAERSRNAQSPRHLAPYGYYEDAEHSEEWEEYTLQGAFVDLVRDEVTPERNNDEFP